ncbi:poly(U)-specific endoribonuclease homolog isoform X3 [Frieseomelitta varia]|nr:poly(U)-specific endoribonuclease homolog isoform X3 [Frieseomelitta varia]
MPDAVVSKPKVATENKQTSPYHPSAPQESIMKSSADTLQGHSTNPAWSNPYYNNKATVSTETHSRWSNPYSETNRPSVLNSQPAASGGQPFPIGFKDYPQTRPTVGTQYNPSANGHPPYPIHPVPSNSISAPHYPTNSMPLGNPYSTHTSPFHSTNSMPLGNPYSTHSSPFHPTNSMPLGNPYSTHPSGPAFNIPGQSPSYYPQQTHTFAQPAVQPFVPGQTIVMMPGQQDSGRGLGQMVKEALVFSTINAGVNRLINPHTHHYESKPVDPASAAPTTHITYNNQYFNTAPNDNDKMNSTNVSQANGLSSPIAPTSNVGGNIPLSQNIPNTSNIPSLSLAGSGTSIIGSRVNENITTSPTEAKMTSGQNNVPNNPASIGNSFYRISDDELSKISEELFAKNSHNMYKYIKMNLQTRVTSSNITTDEATEPLFEVDPELLDYPSIYITRSLYDNYGHDSRKKLNRTLEIRKEENLLIDIFLNTNEMSRAMQWLADHGFIDPDDFERKDVLRRIWFTVFSGSTCGFERVFASENYGTAIIGVQDWIYFEYQESLKRIDYMGYIDKLDLGSTASLIKLNFQMDGIVRPNATIFVGTLPELEMALYTICFYARPNNLCPVSLGGTKFNIYTHSFTYFGTEIIDLALPMF